MTDDASKAHDWMEQCLRAAGFDGPIYWHSWKPSERAEWRLDACCQVCHFPIRTIGEFDKDVRLVDRVILCPNCGARYDFHAEA